MGEVFDNILYDKYDLMENSLLKNIRELAEFCVDYGINNVYDLEEVVEKYYNITQEEKEIYNEVVE